MNCHYVIIREKNVKQFGGALMKLIKIVIGVIVILLSIYSVVTKNEDILMIPFMPLILGALIGGSLSFGIAEFKRKRIGLGLFYSFVFISILVLYIQIAKVVGFQFLKLESLAVLAIILAVPIVICIIAFQSQHKSKL